MSTTLRELTKVTNKIVEYGGTRLKEIPKNLSGNNLWKRMIKNALTTTITSEQATIHCDASASLNNTNWLESHSRAKLALWQGGLPVRDDDSFRSSEQAFRSTDRNLSFALAGDVVGSAWVFVVQLLEFMKVALHF